jgi:hypothetical protein
MGHFVDTRLRAIIVLAGRTRHADCANYIIANLDRQAIQ